MPSTNCRCALALHCGTQRTDDDVSVLKSGIYGLFRLDGAPVDRADVALLELGEVDPPSPARARAVDHRAPHAVHMVDRDSALTIVLGELENLVELAARLNVRCEMPPAMLARAVLYRFGSETPNILMGEWSLLHWDGAQLTLMMSAARRDPLLFAVSGARVAVAPDLFRLSRLPWIGTALDEAGLLMPLGRADLRSRIGDATMLRRVRQLQPGTCVTTGGDAVRVQAPQVLTPPPRWTGSFDDALAETECLLRDILRSRLARTAVPAALLSGGLDSSTLVWIAAEERAADQELVLLTSVAPAGSGLPDEAYFADAVADRLGLRTNHVAPAEEANIYRPSEAILAGANRSPLSTRHCLTDTFQHRGRSLGATLLIDGLYGEMTVTGRSPAMTARARLRRTVSALLRRRTAQPATWPNMAAAAFHVRLSPHRLARLPDRVSEALRTPAALDRVAQSPDIWGYMPGVEKALLHANEFYPGAIRMDLPFRDMRLLRLFAGFPARFLVHEGLDRAPARHMLAGHLPDTIRLRKGGLPASPDHLVRLQRQAPLGRARIAAFRRAGVDEWLDLDWLDQSLARFEAHGPTGYADANEVQLTAITAEFLTWWGGIA